MEESHTFPSPVEYSTPRVLFRGEYRCRNRLTLVGSAILAGIGAGAIFGAVWMFGQGPIWAIHRVVVAPVMAAFGVACFLAAGHSLWGYVSAKRWEVLISDDGIVRDKRLWTWDQIASFGAVLTNGEASIQFQPRRRWGLPWPKALELTPRLSADQYRELATRLIAEVGPRHSHLYIAPEATRD